MQVSVVQFRPWAPSAFYIALHTAQNTFGAIATEYLAHMEANGASESTLSKNRWMLQDLAAPLSDRPIAEIVAAEILILLKRIEKTGRRESARRLRGVIGSVFRHAVVTQGATTDPTFALRGALLRVNVTHRAAITDEMRLGGLMCSIDEYDGWPTIPGARSAPARTLH